MATKKHRFTWHVVICAQSRTILGVYGEALLSEAQERARAIEAATVRPTRVEHVRGPRPFVGGTL